ncbi:DUF1493 family protein [uncultured Cetobacterium sp.]|uniref:DUF1493 family protein n=1 Tax=uncultured Cetobacterium sp. TaxID=527638 RepID=UPI0026107F93|nr:DUF1493 family protein [uncultured Cetobacterium sp.]
MIRKMTKKEILMIKELKQESKILEYEKTLNEIYNSIFNDSDDIFLNDFLKDIHIEKKELKRKTYLPNIHQPIKSELMDIKNTNEFKLEKLTERFELRLTKIEKDIIKALGELCKYNSEIINFQKMLISKIDDVKRSKTILKPSEEKSVKKDMSDSSNSLKIDLDDSQKVLVEISKDDYEYLYEMYLKENEVPNLKSVRIGFDRMNSTKYKIIE